ncbi:cytochrome c5 family protein [Polynucleobacter sp. MWH-Aus1W21]|nr:cytochrome c5 family protein [Polynucleobacter sp. MWH-Aus1W21]
MFFGLFLSGPAFAIDKNSSGEQIYKEVCSVCHTAGVANAPKLGDQNSWKKLIGEGQVIITAHGYVGVRAMPPKGGRQDLSVEQFAEALNFMVNKSGGNWSTPDKPMLDKINIEISNRKKTQ